MLFDAVGFITSLNALLLNHETSVMPYRFWFLGYAVSTFISLVYNFCLVREVSKGYVTRNSEVFTYLLEL
jgi:hypothetical protein